MSTRIPGGSLRERFERFVTTLDGYESVDVLLRASNPRGLQRADYLLSQRSTIIEQKTLEQDPGDRPQIFCEELIKERNYAVYGTIGTNVLFSKIPDGELQKRRMFKHLTENLQQIVRKADKQTRDTRTIFDIPDAMGIVVLLNEGARTLTPDVVRWGLSRAIAETADATELKYSNNTGFILLTELHSVALEGGGAVHPITTFLHPHGAHAEQFAAFANTFTAEWAAFHDLALVPMTMDQAFAAH
jgi:hypothetical protein